MPDAFYVTLPFISHHLSAPSDSDTLDACRLFTPFGYEYGHFASGP